MCDVDREVEERQIKQAAQGKSSASLSSLVLLHSWGVIVFITAYIERLDVNLHDPLVCAGNEDLCLLLTSLCYWAVALEQYHQWF